jgi:hypothetical protein
VNLKIKRLNKGGAKSMKKKRNWWQKFLLKICTADFRKKRTNPICRVGKINWKEKEVKI